MHGGLVVDNVIEGISGVIVLVVHIGRFNLKFFLEYQTTERLSILQELITTREFSFPQVGGGRFIIKIVMFFAYVEVTKRPGVDLVIILNRF